jgi:hypothetical protein
MLVNRTYDELPRGTNAREPSLGDREAAVAVI